MSGTNWKSIIPNCSRTTVKTIFSIVLFRPSFNNDLPKKLNPHLDFNYFPCIFIPNYNLPKHLNPHLHFKYFPCIFVPNFFASMYSFRYLGRTLHTDLDAPIVSKKSQLHQNGFQLNTKCVKFIIGHSPCPLLSTF